LRQITLRELQDIMRACAGEDEGALPLEQAPDQPFDELGYDSLALMETHSRIKKDYGIELAEDEVAGTKTPRELVDFVNSLLKAA
jgi:act minimal PKS acyl carrier protein